jgi:TolB-like protein/Tfp pilus assembly protein PilF
MNEFLQRLKQRKLVQWALAYGAAAFALLQGLDIVAQQFGWPEGVRRGITLALVVGFFVTLVLAWYHGERGVQRVSGTELLIIGLVLAVGGGLLWRFSVGSRETKESVASPLNESKTIPPKSIAVLPFENLSDDKSAAYFADGIQDQILTKLASVADLKVISRTSTTRYKSKPEDLKTVSQQLGVATVLEGTMQKAGDKVRINVQLIDARADSHLWAKTYDRDIQDIFAVESEVAQEIADSLKAKLSPSEANALASAPTKDAQAYDLFLKGEFEQRVANGNFRSESFDQAARWYKEAIARDSNFALAIAQLAICRLRQHWLSNPLSESELAEAGQMAKQAITLAPDLAEAHVAMGVFHYYGFREYEAALNEFQRVIQLQPNNSLALSYIAYVHRRQGKWNATLDECKRALDQDPRNSNLASTIAETYLMLRNWKEAEEMARHSLSIDPHEGLGMHVLLLTSLNRTGKAEERLRLLGSFPPQDLPIPNTGTYNMVVGSQAETFVLARDFDSALKVADTTFAATTNEAQRVAAKAVTNLLAGNVPDAALEAQKVLEPLETRVRQRPQDIRSRRALSWIYLALNRKSDAINLARQTLELLPPDRDAFLGADNLASLAEMQARTGAVAEAVQNLKKLLSTPAGDTISIARLKIDPVWDPIRSDPAFQQLFSIQEHVGP